MKWYTCVLQDVLSGATTVMATAPEKLLVHKGRGNINELKNGKQFLMSLCSWHLGIRVRDWEDSNGVLTFYRNLPTGHKVLNIVKITSEDIVEKIVNIKEESFEKVFEMCEQRAVEQKTLTFFEACHDCSSFSVCRARASCYTKNPPVPLGDRVKGLLNKKIL